jgi:excisionase family DNA binding protein
MIKTANMLKDQYYSIEEVATLLKVAYLTVYRWIRLGKLKSGKAGKQYRINKKDFDEFIKLK